MVTLCMSDFPRRELLTRCTDLLGNYLLSIDLVSLVVLRVVREE